MRTFVFDVPITMAVTVEADSLEEARKKCEAVAEHKSLHIAQDVAEGYVTISPDSGADFKLVDEYEDLR